MRRPSAATVLAGSAWTGALAPIPVPWVAPAVVCLLALRSRRTWLLVVGVALLTSALAHRTLEGLGPLDDEHVRAEATLVSDPRRVGSAVQVDVRIGASRVEVWARGSHAARLAPRLMGERVVLEGDLRPPPPDAPWLVRRHVVGRLAVTGVGPWNPGDPASRAANGLRRTIADGAKPLDPDTRSLYLGLLLGDQREQHPVVADAFAGSGLTHLLAVSGQNVAFVLVLAGPILNRLRLGRRLAATLALLAFFALVTRFEPSVLRATTMAALAATAVTIGREADSRRMLGLAVVVLLLVDPLIARQLAFQLSVAATVGILAWSTSVAAALPGPRPLAEAVGVTVAAQLAVSPLLVPVFGGMPVAALVANVVAAPVTGPVVVWGVPAGIAAGVAGGQVAEVLHLPTRAMVGWIGWVAEWGALLPLGELRTTHLLVVAVGGVGAWIGRRLGVRIVGVLGGFAIVAALAHPAVEMSSTRDGVLVFDDGSRLHRAGAVSVLELDIGARPDVVLAALRRAGVGTVDVVVARHGGRDVAETVAAIRRRSPPRVVLAPSGHRVPQGSVPVPGTVVSADPFRILVHGVSPRLDVEIHADSARAPPV